MIRWVEIRPYGPSDLEACRDLYTQLVEHHREIYDDPSIGGDDPGAGFDDDLALPGGGVRGGVRRERGLWWIYFDRGARLASDVIAASDDPGRLGRSAYTYVHVPMVAGIIVRPSPTSSRLPTPAAALPPVPRR